MPDWSSFQFVYVAPWWTLSATRTCESQLENSQCMHGVLRRTEQFGLTLISNLNSAMAKRYCSGLTPVKSVEI